MKDIRFPEPAGRFVSYDFLLKNKILSARDVRILISNQRTKLNNFFNLEINAPQTALVSYRVGIHPLDRYYQMGWWMEGGCFPYIKEGKRVLPSLKNQWNNIFDNVGREYEKRKHSPLSVDIFIGCFWDSVIPD